MVSDREKRGFIYMQLRTFKGSRFMANSVGMALAILSLSMLTGTAVFAKQTPAPQSAPGSTATPQAPTATDGNPDFPPGDGRDATLAICSKCHSVKNILAGGRDRQGWDDIITKMVGFGATGSDDEFNAILEYLVKNFPPPPPHKASSIPVASPMVAALALTTQERRLLSTRDIQAQNILR